MEEDEYGMSAAELSAKYSGNISCGVGYGVWNEHPVYTLWDWTQDVAKRSTRRGYWDWVACKIAGDYIGD